MFFEILLIFEIFWIAHEYLKSQKAEETKNFGNPKKQKPKTLECQKCVKPNVQRKRDRNPNLLKYKILTFQIDEPDQG